MTTQHDNLLRAAWNVLLMRQADMLTIEEWTVLARAVGACQGRQAADYLTPRDLEDIAEYEVEWNEATDGPLLE